MMVLDSRFRGNDNREELQVFTGWRFKPSKKRMNLYKGRRAGAKMFDF
jgi:hypothetical protein